MFGKKSRAKSSDTEKIFEQRAVEKLIVLQRDTVIYMKSGQEKEKKLLDGHNPFGLGAFVAVITLFFLSITYFDFGDNQYNGEELVTLTVSASDPVERIYETDFHTSQYVLKGREFNCHFRISSGALKVITDHEKMNELMSVKRGDTLKLSLYETDKIKISDLYENVKVFGLVINDNVICTPEQVQFVDKEWRAKLISRASIIGLMILVLLTVVGLLKKRI